MKASVSETARPVARRLNALWWAFPLLGLSMAGLLLIALFLVSTPLILVTVGIPMSLGVAWLARGVCGAQRWIFRTQFDVKILNPYRPWPAGHMGRKLLELAKDATVWRDLAWQAINFSLGPLVYLTYIALPLGTVLALLQPFTLLVPENLGLPTFHHYFGLFGYRDFATGIAFGAPISLIQLGMWWWLGDFMLRGYTRLGGVLLRPTRSARLEQRVVELTESRAENVDASAAELRRIERDLHDGAQARLVALGLSLGMAEEIIKVDPDGAAELLAEARENSGIALAEIRDLVRGIHPPVLADRGLAGAVEALGLDHPLPVTLQSDLPGRPPAPVESAAYFAVAEMLTNVAKYAEASRVHVRIGYFTGGDVITPRLGIVVRDNGKGGAEVTPGGGLAGVARRLGVFDGRMTVTSPDGGPTVIAFEVPCELTAVAPSSDA